MVCIRHLTLSIMSNNSNNPEKKKTWKFSSGEESFEYGNTKGLGDVIRWIRDRKSKKESTITRTQPKSTSAKKENNITPLQKKEPPQKEHKWRRRFFWGTAILVWLLFGIGLEVFWGLFFSVIVWGWFLYYDKKTAPNHKRTWGIYIICWIISLFLFGMFPGKHVPEPSWETVESQRSFDTDFSWSDPLRQQYAQQADLQEILMSGPFYTGNFSGLDGYTQNYQKARNYKVQNIVKVLDESIDIARSLNNTLKIERGLFEWYILQLITFEPQLSEVLLPLLDQSNQKALRNTAQIIKLDAIKAEVSGLPDSPESGFWTYAKYALLTDTIETFTEEVQAIRSQLLSLYFFLEEDENIYYREVLNKTVDQTMGKTSIQVDTYLRGLYLNNASLAYEEKMLFTADYHFAQEVVAYVQSESKNLQESINNYNGNKAFVDPETLEFMRGTVDGYQETVSTLSNYLEQVPSSDLIDEQDAIVYTQFFPTAHASWGNPYTFLKSAVTSAGVQAYSIAKEGASLTWEATKATASVAKNVVIGGVKTVGHGFGVVLDTVDAGVKTMVDTGQGMYYLEDPKIVRARIKSHFGKVYQNIVTGRSGSIVYQNATKVLESAEDFASWAAESATESTLGKGLTSTALGFVAKTTVGFFTGLAKDSYMVLDPTASDTDTLTSLAGVLLSFTGGSKSVMTGSQAVKATAPKAGKILSRLRPTNVMKSLRSTFSNWFTKKAAANANVISKSIRTQLTQAVQKQSKDGISLLKSTVNKASKSYREMFTPTNYKKAFKDLMGIDGKTTKMGIAKGFFDNIVGAVIDDGIKAQFNTAANYFGVSNQSIPSLEDRAEQDARTKIQALMLSELKAAYREDETLKKEVQQALDDLQSGDIEVIPTDILSEDLPVEPSAPEGYEVGAHAREGKLIQGGEYSHLAAGNRGMEVYLGNGGATAGFAVSSQYAGEFDLHVKVHDDGAHSSGTRSATFIINDVEIPYNHVSQNTGGWAWRYVGKARLIQGQNDIKVRKNRTTSAAFVMNEFKLEAIPQTDPPPEE